MTIKGEVTARPQVFAAAVKWAAKFIATKPAAPVQGGLLLDVGEGVLTISAMNEHVSAVATVLVDGIGEGRAVVSGRLLNDLVGTFPDKPVTISGDVGYGHLVRIEAGRWKGTLPMIVRNSGEDEFPALPATPAQAGTVQGEEFSRMIAESAAGTGKKDDVAVQWRSLHLTFGAGEVRAIGTDSKRMVSAACGFAATGEGGQALVLAQPMVDVAAGFVGPDTIIVGLSPTSISLDSPTRSVVMRQTEVIGGQYPIESVLQILAQEQPEHAVVRVADLGGPLKRASIMAKESPVALGFTGGSVTVGAQSGQVEQDGAEPVDAQYSGPDVVLYFNAEYLSDALGSAPGEKVDIALTEKTGRGGRPGHVVFTVEGSAWRHVLMPIKVE